ncbi:zinc ABC transporter permease subunit ZnuB [Aurantivibrio plasticivorans]
MPNFILYALLAGIGVALLTGPLGSFVVWRRMAYLGDTLAHSALFGVALGLLLSINLNIAIVAVCTTLALLFVAMQHNQSLATDTLLGILAHSSLALGLVAVAIIDSPSVNLFSYMFGDLLATSTKDIALIYGVGVIVLCLLIWFWRQLLSFTVQADLAKVEGINTTFIRTLLMVLLAVVIAVAMKVVGVLLVTALLIIPAATSRRLSKTPEQMAIVSALIGCLAVCGGLAASYWLNTPTGPSIVLSATTFFVISLSKKVAI